MARGGSAARRYAEAVFELAERDNALDRWRDDLATAAQVASDDPAVAAGRRQPDACRSPSAKAARRSCSASGCRSRPSISCSCSLQRGKLDLVAPIAAEYHRLLNRRRGIVSASSRAPRRSPPTRMRRSAPASPASRARPSTSRPPIDPALIGGLTVRIGDRLIDASVRGRLERLREQLLAGARVGG